MRLRIVFEKNVHTFFVVKVVKTVTVVKIVTTGTMVTLLIIVIVVTAFTTVIVVTVVTILTMVIKGMQSWDSPPVARRRSCGLFGTRADRPVAVGRGKGGEKTSGQHKHSRTDRS